MNRTAFTFVVLILSICVANRGWPQNSMHFSFTGDATKVKTSLNKVYLGYYQEDKMIIDSAVVTSGKYRFQGNIDIANPACLIPGELNPNRIVSLLRQPSPELTVALNGCVLLFLEPTTFSVVHTDTFKNCTILRSNANADFKLMQPALSAYNYHYGILFKLLQLADSVITDSSIKRKITNDIVSYINQSEVEKKKNVYFKFALDHPTSNISLFSLRSYAGENFDPHEIIPAFNKLSLFAKESKSGKSFRELIDRIEKTAVGSIAMDFVQTDTSNMPFRLSSLRGNYVLLDFWASWCVPCRKENPNIVSAYNQYKHKNFKIVSVSLDNNRRSWINAIKEDNLEWIHVSDLKYWNNKVAEDYNINSVPTNFLLDPSGKIVERNLRGLELNMKLKEIFESE